MTTTQRPRPRRSGPPAPDPASRGVILVVVAVVLGVILLVRGGGVGFDTDADDLEIGGDGGGDGGAEVTTTTPTTEAPPETSVPPAELQLVALNGAGVDGYAGRAQQFFNVAGYTSTAAITAADLVESTTVYFAPGFEVDATAVAFLLGLQPEAVQPLPEEQLARDPAEFPAATNVAVVLGPDVAPTIDAAASTTTSTTAATGGG